MDWRAGTYLYFLGIGGIGMSALARYFNTHGHKVSGFDRTPTPLTNKLQKEGIAIHFTDSEADIPGYIRENRENTLVVRTPAIKEDNREWHYLRSEGYTIRKRSEILGSLVASTVGLAVAGTHGKTTISTMLAHILTSSGVGCNAFLGGIASNYGTNYLANAKSQLTVVEADEFDRSFLTLNPTYAIISSLDADHLDIYDNAEELRDTFIQFGKQVRENGVLLTRLELDIHDPFKAKHLHYSAQSPTDFFASDIRVENGRFVFTLHLQNKALENCELGIPGRHNIENAVAAAGIAYLNGASPEDIKSALSSFAGVYRRFDIHVRNDRHVYVDDYAHHPTELRACISALRELYPGRKVAGIFQPHLFSRTRDFADGFADALSGLDEVILLPIYPAREKPLPGIDSQMLLNKISNTPCRVVQKSELLGELESLDFDVLVTLGAGDIDQLVNSITHWLTT
ncbi:MAG: UDP-N-acetylmuramate--L-alanine ligase [Flavobacteriales bacterium]|nr:UDP-N-acetylmuramate--L-alanine ligase [Flavobacteriales bacterium]